MKIKVKVIIPQQAHEIEMDFQPIWEMEPPIIEPKPKPPVISPPTDVLIPLDWNNVISKGQTHLPDGNYIVDKWSASNKDVILSGSGNVNVYFGSEDYSRWDSNVKQERFLFTTSENSKIWVKGVNLYCNAKVEEVQPFFMTIFYWRGRNQNLVLEDVKTNMELGFLYSASQEVTQIIEARRVKFKGIMWQELKAPAGGGLKSIMRDCELDMVDPVTHFPAELTLTNPNQFRSSVKFARIENDFIENGNSANILFVSGMTFYLPKSSEMGYEKTIRPIPTVGQTINLTWTGKFLRTNQYELQVGDILNIGGVDRKIMIKDRVVGVAFEASSYSIEFKLDIDLEAAPGTVTATVVASGGLALIGRATPGYMIFKYNKHFQTNVDVDHGLEYMLKSNPFGVLSYNHQEITVDWENVRHNGYYRQTNSGVGYSNGYRVINCTGLQDEFNPPRLTN